MSTFVGLAKKFGTIPVQMFFVELAPIGRGMTKYSNKEHTKPIWKDTPDKGDQVHIFPDGPKIDWRACLNYGDRFMNLDHIDRHYRNLSIEIKWFMVDEKMAAFLGGAQLLQCIWSVLLDSSHVDYYLNNSARISGLILDGKSIDFMIRNDQKTIAALRRKLTGMIPEAVSDFFIG